MVTLPSIGNIILYPISKKASTVLSDYIVRTVLLLRTDKIIVDHIGQTLHRGVLSDVVSRGLLGEKDIYATSGLSNISFTKYS